MAGFGGGGGGGAAIKAGRAFVELFAEDNKVYRALDRLKGRFQSFGKMTAKIGLGAAGVGAGALVGLKPAIDGLGEAGKIADLADVFGISAEKASRLFGILGAAGSDLRDAQEGLATLNQRVNDALTGKGEEAAELFKELGVSAQEFAGLDTADRLYRLIDAVKASESPLGKLGLLMKGVGEDTGKNLSSLLTLSADQMRELGDASQSGAADLQSARDASRAVGLASASISRVWREVAVAIAPTVQEIAGNVVHAARTVGQFVANNREAVVAVAAAAAGLAAGGVALIGFGAAVSAAGTAVGLVVAGLKLLAAGVALLLSPIGLVVAAAGGLAYLFRNELMGAAREAWGYLAELFAGVGSAAVETWGGIVAAVQKGDLELAMRVAAAGVDAVWQELMLGLRKGWNDFVRWLVGFLKNNPWVLPAIGAAVGFAVGGPGGALAGAAAGGLGALAVNEFSDEIVRGLSVDLTEATAAVAKARAELRGLVAEAKAPGGGRPVAEAPKYGPGGRPLTPADLGVVASRGTFGGSQLKQQLAQGDTFQKRQQKVQDAIKDNTKRAADAAEAMAKGPVFK